MKKRSTARRFAKALISIAREEDAVQKFRDEITLTNAVFAKTPELYKVLLNPVYTAQEKNNLLNKLCSSLSLAKHTERLLTMLVETRNIGLLPEITSCYQRLEDELSGRIRVTVEAPHEIAGSVLEEIRKKISEETGKEAVLDARLNTALLGGMVLRIDNTLLDGSIKKQLELLREKIAEGAA